MEVSPASLPSRMVCAYATAASEAAPPETVSAAAPRTDLACAEASGALTAVPSGVV